MSVFEFHPPDPTAESLFLDRDGTLIVDTGYLRDPSDVTLLPGVAAALAGWSGNLFLFTNQSGINRGYLTWDDFWNCTQKMNTLLDLGAEPFAAVGVAPEKPDEPSLYRKPSPRFIEEMRAKYGLPKERCWMVGDKASDVRAGLAAGIHAIGLTDSGKPGLVEDLTIEEKERAILQPDLPTFLASHRSA